MTPEQYDLVEAIFLLACELPLARRSALLDERCGGDPIVRAAVEAMLAADEEGGDVLSEPALPANGLTRVFDEDTDRREQYMPERIGHYRIIRECGHGGMGVVYEAEQDSPSRRVALKVVRTGVVGRGLLRRFHRESEVLGRLQHPGIGQIFEAGSFDVGEGGQPFFAMEYVEGSSLIEHATTLELDVRGRLALFLRVCEAVHYAHQMGVIHRDLKPDNVLVDIEGHPKVLDFGIARMTDSDVQFTTMRTDAGQLIGTLQYMSPEQTTGDSRELDTRSDVYALGVMLFELLSERLPHDLRNRSIPESVLVIRQDEPKRLSAVSPALRGDLDTIVGKCLEKEPGRRYASAADLAEDIRRHLRDEPITAQPPSAMYQLRKFALRNRALVGGILATILTLVAGIIVASAFAVRASRLAEISARNEATALAQAYRAEIVAAQALIETDPAEARIRLENAPPEHRNWEWHHLMHRLKGRLDDLVAGGSLVGAPAQTADGSVLAVRADGVVVRWDSGQPGRRTTVAELGVQVRDRNGQVAFSAGARRVAVLSVDDEVCVHDLATDAPIDVPPLPGGTVPAAITWDSSGEQLIAARPDSIGTWSPGQDWVIHPLDRTLALTDRFVDLQAVPGTDRTIGLGKQGTHGSEIVLLEPSSGRIVATHQHEEGVLAMRVSPDGRQVAAGYGYRTVRLLDAATLEVLSSPGSHLSNVLDVAFSPDGSLLCSIGADGAVRLWDPVGNSPLLVLQAGTPQYVRFSSDGSKLLCLEMRLEEDNRTVGADRIRRWNLSDTGSTVLRGHGSYVYDLGWSPDGSRLASIDFESDLCVWDMGTGRFLRRFELEGQSWTPGQFRTDGTLVLDVGGRFALADPATGALELRPLRRFVLSHSCPESALQHAIWRTDYNATGEDEFIVRATVNGEMFEQVLEGALHRLAPVPQPIVLGKGEWGFSGALAELIIMNGRLSDDDASAIERYLEQRREAGHGEWPQVSSATLVARFVADASSLAIDAEGLVRSWIATNDSRIVLRAMGRQTRLDETAMNGHPTLRFQGRMEGVLPGDARLGDTTVFWLGHYDTGRSGVYAIGLEGVLAPEYLSELRSLLGGPLAGSRLTCAAAVRADGLVATAGLHFLGIRLADGDGYQGVIPGAYQCVAFHPDGRHLAAGSYSGTIDIWDVSTRKKVAELVGHQGIVYGVDYSPDGTRLVSGGNDTTVRIWDIATGAQVLELRGHRQYVKSVVFSPDGSRIATASGDMTVRIWESAEPAR